MYSIFKTFVLSVLMVAQVHFAYAQNAAILPPAKTTFVDQNGKPLTAGTVDFYIPGTSTRKTTWQDSAATIANTNPVVLDSAGRALILGNGAYRQVVKDRNDNIIWDQVTNSAGAGGSGQSLVGDGLAVGSIVPFSGLAVPANYAFAYGQEISRTTYAVLKTAITISQNITCVSGNATVINVSDTSQLNIGAAVEAACLPANSTIVSKTSNTVTVNNLASVSTTTVAVFYPWGGGNGLTTFNVPDLRGVVLPGRNNMGGASSAKLSAPYYTDPDALGGGGGSQNKTLLASDMPSHTHTATVTDPGHAHNVLNIGTAFGAAAGGTNVDQFINNQLTQTSSTGITVANSATGGGTAVSATVGAGGSGYTAGTQLLTVSGGTCSVQPQFNVTISAGAITAPVLVTAGLCSVIPSNPAATTGGGGTGGTLNITYSANPISLIQPSKTINYIIKILPDSNISIASGVSSLGLMTGDIACGTGVICSAGTISATQAGVGSLGGMTGAINCGDNTNCSGNTISSITITSVATRTALKALDTTLYKTAMLTEANRTGIFNFVAGNYTSAIAADTNEGVYVKANAISAGTGSWVREFDFVNYQAKWFGAVADYSTDNTAIINSMLTVGNIQNTLSTAGKQTAIYINVEGGVKFASQNIQWFPSVNWAFAYIRYFANSDTTLGVSTGGGASNEYHVLSVNSGYPGDVTGALVSEDMWASPLHPTRGVNIQKNIDNSIYAHSGTTQSVQPYDNGPATATDAYIRDENLDRFRLTYTNYGANTRVNGTAAYVTNRVTSLTATNVGVGAGWAGASVPVAGDVVRGITTLSRYVVTSLATNILTTEWLSGTAVPGETLLRERAIFKASFSGTTMTVTSFLQGSGNLAVGQTCVGLFPNNGITAATTISVSAGGGTGAYTMNNSMTVAQTLVTCGPLSVNTIQGGGVSNTDTTYAPMIFYKKGEVVVNNRAFASLNTCSSLTIGAMASISDSNTAVWGANIAGGGANQVLGYCNGTAWTVMAK